MQNPTDPQFKPAFFLIQSPPSLARVWKLTDLKCTVGRKETNTICIKDHQISSQHAELQVQEHDWWIRDLQSRNGIFVNGKKVDSQILKHGDIIRLGETTCVFQYQMPKTSQCMFYLFRGTLLAFMLGILVGIAWITYSYLLQPSRNLVHDIPGNLLEDFSFEQGIPWEYNMPMKIQTEVAHSGNAALLYVSKSNSVQEAAYNHSIRLTYNRSYVVGYWIQTQALQGIAGLKLIWLQKDRKISETYSPLTTGTQPWQNIEFTVYPPMGADHLKLACIASGETQAVYWDDVYILEELATSDHYTIWNGLKFHLDTRGVLWIASGSDVFFNTGIITLGGSINQSLISQEFGYLTSGSQSNPLHIQGFWHNLQSGQKIPVEVQLQFQGDQAILTYQGKMPTTRIFLQQIFEIAIDYFPKYKWPPPSETIQIQEQDLTLYLSKHSQKCTMSWPKPLDWQATCKRNQIELQTQVLLGTDGNFLYKIQIQTQPLLAQSQLKQWIMDAQNCIAQGNWGQAGVLYQKILIEAGTGPLVEHALEQIQTLQKQFEQDWQGLAQSWSHARFFHTLQAYQSIQTQSQVLAEKWRGYQVNQWTPVIAQIQSEVSRLQEMEKNRKARLLLQQAEQLEKEESLALAFAFYQEILNIDPNSTQAENIKSKIEKIKLKLKIKEN